MLYAVRQGDTRNITAYVQSAQLTPAALPLTSWSQDPTYPRQPGMLAPVAGSSISVTGGQQIAPGQPIGVSGKRLRLQVPAGSGATFVPAGYSGGSKAADGQVFLTGSFPPGDRPGRPAQPAVDGDDAQRRVRDAERPRPGGVPTLQPCRGRGEPRSRRGGGRRAERHASAATSTTLTLAAPLTRIYDAGTVTVNANAVQATNGQTVQEILGSGDAHQPRPAVHAEAGAADLPARAERERLAVHPAGLGQQPAVARGREPAHRRAGRPRVRHQHRTRPATRSCSSATESRARGTPTGTWPTSAPSTATASAAPGMVSAGQLSQPLDRPQGLSSVTNPGAASGAADPATADQARASAPLPTLTIGRVVSLEDYQNYALGFAGIAKALATWTWFGNVRGVFLTVAGAGGAALSGDDPVVTGLIAAIRLSGDPHVPLQVASYRPVLFTFTAAVVVDQAGLRPGPGPGAGVAGRLPPRSPSASASSARASPPSEIIEIIQQIAGVIAVQLQALGRSGSAAPGPGPGDAVRQRARSRRTGAELLQLDPATQGRIGALVMSLDADQLFALLPAVYRTRDAAGGGQLQALFAVMAAQSAIVEDNISQLYDDQFIETCAPWVIPYIGDLIGYNSIYEVAAASSDSRAEVANTIGYRRRKGTLLALEQLAMDVSGRAAARGRGVPAADHHREHAPRPAPPRRDREPARRPGARTAWAPPST